MSRVKDFLSRIGQPLDTDTAPSVELLEKIHYGCVVSIPYENMDIINGVPLPTEKDGLFDKIVTRKRGGYCFELNAFLEFMLSEFGFCARSCLARFLRGEKEVPLRRHRIVIVSLSDKRYFCDIGIGQIAPRFPLLLEENTIQEQCGEVYKFVRNSELGWVLWELHDGKWRKFISFTEEKQYEVDFIPHNFYCEKHPDSPFHKAPIIAIKTHDGRKTINNRDFKIFSGEELIYIETDISDSRFFEILSKEFGINLNQNV